MAVKSKAAGFVVRELKVGKPVISSDVMGNRNIEVRAVGAWVQPEADSTGYEHQHGVISARQEENRLRLSQQEKEERLKQFQKDVKRRVKALDRAKKEKLVEKSVKEIEKERNVVRQSAFVKGHVKTRIDNSVHRQSDIAIHSPRARKVFSEENNNPAVSRPGFLNKKEQSHTVINQARKNLMSRQVIANDFRDEESTDAEILNGGNQTIYDRIGQPNENFQSEYTKDICESLDRVNLRSEPKSKNVHFDLRPQSGTLNGQETLQHTVGRTYGRRSAQTNVPEIYVGVITEEEKRRKQIQHATYRRLFMGIEREQVKENLRKKEHRKRIARLKKEKEDNRRSEEDEARYLVEPWDPLTGETEEETVDREHLEEVSMRKVIEEQQAKLQRAKEMERYVNALKYRLRARIEERDLQLPPLCCCADSIWDTNPDTCANNCIFYKNPKGYARALQSLLSSFDVL